MSVGGGDHFHRTRKILQKVLITITTILAHITIKGNVQISGGVGVWGGGQGPEAEYLVLNKWDLTCYKVIKSYLTPS